MSGRSRTDTVTLIDAVEEGEGESEEEDRLVKQKQRPRSRQALVTTVQTTYWHNNSSFIFSLNLKIWRVREHN